MENIEREFEQGTFFLLGQKIFDENILFSQAIVPCFLKEKLFQNKLFYAKNVKTAGQFKLSEVIFQNMDQNENTCTKKKKPEE